MTRMIIALAALAIVAPAAAAPRHEAPAITPDQAKQLLSMSGANVGTVRLLEGIGRVRIDGIKVGADGPWLVIRVLTTLLK